jgi:hypothetical protein
MLSKANPVPRGGGRVQCHFGGCGTVLLAWLMMALLFSVGTALADEPQLTESKLKAAFLFNFVKFVEWPPESFAATNSPIAIGILGENPFGGDLAAIVRDKTINNRPIIIRTMPSLAEATNCHVLFIGASENGRIPEIISKLGTASILTVGDFNHFTEAGGMINFVRENNKIRFQINEAAAKNARLKISSKLLSLATHGSK